MNDVVAPKRPRWTIDGVVQAMMMRDEIKRLVRLIETMTDQQREEDCVVHANAGGEDVLSSFGVNVAGNDVHIVARGLWLAPRIIYRTRPKRDIGDPHGMACVEISNHAMAETLMAAAVGRPISHIIDHPAFTARHLVVTGIERIVRQGVSSAWQATEIRMPRTVARLEDFD